MDVKLSVLGPTSPTSGGVVTLKTGFLRNLRKYRLGSLERPPTEGTPPVGSGPTNGRLALNLQPNPTLALSNG